MGYIYTRCFFNAMSLCSLTRLAALACLNRTPMAVLQKLSSTVLCVCHGKPPKSRLAPPKLPEPQVHFVHIASLSASSVGRICDTMWEFGALMLTVQGVPSRHGAVPSRPKKGFRDGRWGKPGITWKSDLSSS